MSKHIQKSLFALLLLLLVACGQSTSPTGVTQVAMDNTTETPVPAPTPSATKPATLTPKPTSTPTLTPTPTPTPTAIPAVVLGNPRGASLQDPIPQPNVRCGFVDVLDFPLNPPDGVDTWGGRDFGTHRERYHGYHAGEDWRLNRSRNQGVPVYSIGHGMVTYAQPRGWGRDGGVVIVQHAFRDGRRVLSFYGHLSPKSVALRAGDCVERGDRVGRIGDRQHLHFEIRTHMPKQPGPGYWSVDPTLAGWIPPSQFIWHERLKGSPGVVWMREMEEGGRRAIGMLDDGTFAVLEGGKLVGIDLANGEARWRRPILGSIASGAVDFSGETVYLVDRVGMLAAYRAPDLSGEGSSANSNEPLQPVWQINFSHRGDSKLLSLTEGGVSLSMDGGLYGVSEMGEQLWELDSAPLVEDWALDGERLIFTTNEPDPGIWTVENGEPHLLDDGAAGQLALAGDQIFIYDAVGVFGLDAEVGFAELIYPLPEAYRGLGDILVLPDGGLLLAHRDLRDRRLIALNEDGSLRWERSYTNLVRGDADLFVRDERVYLLLVERGEYQIITSLLLVDPDNGNLKRIFDGGTRDLNSRDVWAFAINDGRVLINVGGFLSALDTNEALQSIFSGGG
ncbi:MAG: peptidoglycan DD-metalloendopeptidase family protein [Chloroflexota bacterium]|nr:peptidoglycan DD-metalloendopeptidase family protein [Chloroflexota bacterium]